MMRAICLLIFIISLMLSGSASDAAFDSSMYLQAQPQAIVADSHSIATVTAEVRDSSGRAVADGTEVNFTTSLGIIERSAKTRAGVARARLTSGATTGTALVSAMVQNGMAVAQLRVDFLAPGTEMFSESFITISSDKQLGYDVGGQIVDSAGGAKIYHRGLTITAEEAQINVKANVLRAKCKTGGDNILIKRGDKQLSASVLYYDFNAMKGVIITPAEDGANRLLFRGRDLFTEPDLDPAKSVKLEFTPVTQCTMFIRARSIVIRPGEEVKIKRANFYLEGDKVLSAPLHVVPLRGENGGVNQMLAYGTEGLRVDVPLYYSLTPNSTGAVRLKHADSSGWGSYSGNSAWRMDIDQDYNIAGSAAGTFALNRITSKDWGMQWNQRQELGGNSQLYSSLSSSDHKSLYSMLNYSRPIGAYTFSSNFNGNIDRSRGTDYAATSYLQSPVKPLIGDAVSYSFGTTLSYDSALVGLGNSLGAGLGLQLFGKTLQLGSSSSLNTSLLVNHDRGGRDPGTTTYANASLSRSLGKVGQFSLNYSLLASSAAQSSSSRRISADLFLSPSRKWSTRLSCVHDFANETTSAFGDLSYRFLPTWRVQMLGRYQTFNSSSYGDAEIALAKALGRQEGRLIWSQSRKRFRVEFSALGF